MTENEMCACLGEDIKITCTDGKVYVGHCCSFDWAIDNEPEIATIGVRTAPHSDTVFFQNEIESIEILEKKGRQKEILYSYRIK